MKKTPLEIVIQLKCHVTELELAEAAFHAYFGGNPSTEGMKFQDDTTETERQSWINVANAIMLRLGLKPENKDATVLGKDDRKDAKAEGDRQPNQNPPRLSDTLGGPG